MAEEKRRPRNVEKSCFKPYSLSIEEAPRLKNSSSIRHSNASIKSFFIIVFLYYSL